MVEQQASRTAILIVEDEALLRLDARDFLEEAGFDVFEAANAEGAIEILEREPEIRLVFTDVNMPGSMDGVRLAHYVRRRWPPTKIIVVSGKDRVAEGDLPNDVAFFSKPYRASQIVQKVRHLLDAA